ncbi:hypothetical protein vseg_012209 [Gypsophila vaccaria]
MECNKEEASRAKDVAEKKMQNKDFVGARKFILKAQQLYPELENISQLLSVCDVHCSAENKMFGNDKDWYGILQVEQTADDTLIKKQYRKFALLLHPDKNQFAGAEAAFKLIGEAQRILLDKEKRASHDMKRRTPYKPVFPYQASQSASRTSGVVRQSRPPNNFASNPNSHFRTSNFPNQGQTHQTQPANAKETFWTVCLHCAGRYEYFKDVLGRAIFCASCKKPFVAFPQQDVPCAPTFDAGFQAGQKAGVSGSQKGPNKVERKRNERSKLQKAKSRRRKKQIESSESSESFDTSFDSEEVETDEAEDHQRSQKGPNKGERKRDGSSKLRNTMGRRRKRQVESSESSDSSDTSLDSEEEEMHEAADHQRSQHFNSDGNNRTRRSNRNRPRVSYAENESDDEQVATPSKKAKGNDSAEETVDASTPFSSDFGEESTIKKDDRKEVLDRPTKSSFEARDGIDSSLEDTKEPTCYVYPDPEFCDFDQTRRKDCFKVGQLWAVYDTVDAMPRYYAKIIAVPDPDFKLQITWLEAHPDDKFGTEWTKLKLPFGCGKFKLGGTEGTEHHGMFSHVVCGHKSIGRNSFRIYPNVGETWAIFKNWDAKWRTVPENERKFEYEFVEILCDFKENVGIRVAPLGKVKGFASLFCRRSVKEIQIPYSEVLRFSHMVPSYRTTGNERIDVPKGLFELDPASITMNHEEISLPL